MQKQMGQRLRGESLCVLQSVPGTGTLVTPSTVMFPPLFTPKVFFLSPTGSVLFPQLWEQSSNPKDSLFHGQAPLCCSGMKASRQGCSVSHTKGSQNQGFHGYLHAGIC